MAAAGSHPVSGLAASRAIHETVPHILERLGLAVGELTSDSRKAAPGTVFAAYPGEARDGDKQQNGRGAGNPHHEEVFRKWK